MTPVILPPLKEMLPIIRKAFDNEDLQMFRAGDFPQLWAYNGPCAIGVCIPDRETRDYLDSKEDSSIDYLIDQGIVQVTNQHEVSDIVALQTFHDSVLIRTFDEGKSKIKEFENLLITLEDQYL